MAKKQPQVDYNKKFEAVCQLIESGLAVRKATLGMISLEKFYSMIQENEELAKRYAHACDIRAESIFEDILDIADDSSADVVVGEDGIEKPNSEIVQRSKLRVDARKWVLAKMNPKKYGDKIDVDSKVTHDGEVGLVVKVGYGENQGD